jgi:hypothetical protein
VGRVAVSIPFGGRCQRAHRKTEPSVLTQTDLLHDFVKSTDRRYRAIFSSYRRCSSSQSRSKLKAVRWLRETSRMVLPICRVPGETSTVSDDWQPLDAALMENGYMVEPGSNPQSLPCCASQRVTGCGDYWVVKSAVNHRQHFTGLPHQPS